MVIRTPHVVKSFLNVRDEPTPYEKLLNSTKSSIAITLTEKGCVFPSTQVFFTDIQCYVERITIGRVSACTIQILDDSRISRYHSAIECSREGVWSFRDIGSKSGSALKPKSPKFGTVLPKTLDPRVPYLLQDHNVILIGKVHCGLAHQIVMTIQRPAALEALKKDHPSQDVRRLTWRRSLYCNGCMGWGRRHSCSARLSKLQKFILECNANANVDAPRPIKTAIQKVLFHRLSGWWPKKEEKTITFEIPKRYENNTLQTVEELPDSLLPEPEPVEENQDADIDPELDVEPETSMSSVQSTLGDESDQSMPDE